MLGVKHSAYKHWIARSLLQASSPNNLNPYSNYSGIGAYLPNFVDFFNVQMRMSESDVECPV
jgi:hypothetical protein